MKVRRVEKTERVWFVKDSREGFAETLNRVLEEQKDGRPIQLDLSEVRRAVQTDTVEISETARQLYQKSLQKGLEPENKM